MHRVLIPDTREAIRAYDSLFGIFILGLPVFDMEFSEVSRGCLQQSVFIWVLVYVCIDLRSDRSLSVLYIASICYQQSSIQPHVVLNYLI